MQIKYLVANKTLSFVEIIDIGKAINPESINKQSGLPWSFSIGDIAFTHENDENYIVSTSSTTKKFNINDSIYISEDLKSYILNVCTGLTFHEATNFMDKGEAVARLGWKEKNVFVYYEEAASYPTNSPIAKKFFGENVSVPYLGHMAIKNEDDMVSRWFPSTVDIIAKDWFVFPVVPKERVDNLKQKLDESGIKSFRV